MRLPRWLNAKIILIIAVLFFFLAPVVPMTVSAYILLPEWNYCYIQHPGGPPVPLVSDLVFVAPSYALFGIVFHNSASWGLFGLALVPGNGWYTLQFPPIGFGQKMCF